ncbi:MAG: hypothetical protein IT285_09840 [Bdellovibrionales bacterium]|nr:hypothetical protein [Bdellovibrionales bacterium]
MKTIGRSSQRFSPKAGWYSTQGTLALAAAAALALSGAGCELDGVAVAVMDDAFVSEGYEAGSPTEGEPAEGCHLDRFQQPDAQITRNIDVLFLVDTSGSLNEERGAVANGIDAFVAALPANVSYRVGVMLAHGPGSSRSGRLYRRNATYPYVYSSDEMDLATLRTRLRETLTTGVATENATDGGEAMLVSLNRAMDDDRLAEMRGQGFLRDDAALAVVIVTDEQDICAEFPEGVTPVVDGQGIEPVAKANLCTRMAPAKMDGSIILMPSHQEAITPDLVLAKVKAMKRDLPVVVGGVIYTDPDLINAAPGAEDEVGYGITDFVDLAGGVLVELSTGQYDDGLNEIGVVASIRMNLQAEFGLSHANANPDSIQVFVDGNPAAYNFLEATNTVQVSEPGQPLSVVDIRYCDRAPEIPVVGGVDAMCSAGEFVPKAELRVGMSIHLSDGSLGTIQAGLSQIGITPTIFSDQQIIDGVPQAQGITVMIVTRRMIVSPATQSYVDGLRAFVAAGGSVLAEYDGGALMFDSFVGVNAGFQDRMPPSLALFEGNAAGGGLLLPTTASTMTVTDVNDPLMAGLTSTSITTGLRTAFAITDFNSTWLHSSATFTSTGASSLVPAGTFPAVMKGRCGGGRVTIVMMNQLQSLSGTTPGALDMRQMFTNAFSWLIGQ